MTGVEYCNECDVTIDPSYSATCTGCEGNMRPVLRDGATVCDNTYSTVADTSIGNSEASVIQILIALLVTLAYI